MPCATCGNQMELVGNVPGAAFWCHRRGSIYDDGETTAPRLIERCRRYVSGLVVNSDVTIRIELQKLGIYEAIGNPEGRS
jgi:hypothetical protein